MENKVEECEEIQKRRVNEEEKHEALHPVNPFVVVPALHVGLVWGTAFDLEALEGLAQ